MYIFNITQSIFLYKALSFLTFTNVWFSICAYIFFLNYFLSKHHPKITHYAMHISKDKHSNASVLEQPLLGAHSYLWAFLAHLSERLKRVFLIKICKLSVVMVVIVYKSSYNFLNLGKIYLGQRSPGPR